MTHLKFLNFWEHVLAPARSHFLLLYISLMPVLYFLNSHHGPLKGFLVGCGLLTLGLWQTGRLRQVSPIILLSWLSLIYTVVVVLISFSGGSFMQEREAFRLCYKVLFLAGFVSGAYYVVKQYGVDTFLFSLKVCTLIGGILSLGCGMIDVLSMSVERLFPIGLLMHPILGGSVYGMVAVIGLYHFLYSKDLRPLIFNGAVFLIAVMVVAFTRSRGPLVALGGGVALVFGHFLWFQSERITKETKKLLWGIGGGAVLFIVIVNCINPKFWLSLWEKGNSFRLYIWKETWKLIQETFPWGAGYKTEMSIRLSTEVTINHPHNLFISKLYREGVIGLTFLITLLVMCAHKVRRVWQSRDGALAGILVIHGVLSCLTDTSSFWDGKNSEMLLFFWFPIIFLAGLNDDKRETKSYR